MIQHCDYDRETYQNSYARKREKQRPCGHKVLGYNHCLIRFNTKIKKMDSDKLCFVVNDLEFFLSHRIDLAKKLSHSYQIHLICNSKNASSTDLNSTGVPEDFVLEYRVLADDYQRLEKEIHQRLKKYRLRTDKEFFEIFLLDTLTR